MKILTPQQMREIEVLAYQNGASESDFIEEAGSGVALVVHDFAERNNLDRIIILLVGKGNNGADAYVAGLHLLHLEYDVLSVQLNSIEECSPLCRQSYERFITEGGRQIEYIQELPSSGLIVDGLFGTGFQGEVNEPYKTLIELANNSHLPIISIDIPSGLNGTTGRVEGVAIVATETAFLGAPKIGFFLNEGWNVVGKLRYVNFGLPEMYLDNISTDFIMLSEDILKDKMPTIVRNRHKYEAGEVVGMGGSKEMPGAPILASISALHGGAGIVKLLYPEEIKNELSNSPYELIRIPFSYDNEKEILKVMNKARALFIGPGLGRSAETRTLLMNIIPKLEKPCVLDADALFFLAEENISIPKETVLTPHMAEMLRLLHFTNKPPLSVEFLKICQQYASNKQVTLVLKGGPSFIIRGDEPILINPTGDPGMATAGSGDLLTGLIASFLAQKLPPKEAASLAVFLHGLAGEHAAYELTSYGVTASDILYHYPEAFKFFLLS